MCCRTDIHKSFHHVLDWKPPKSFCLLRTQCTILTLYYTLIESSHQIAFWNESNIKYGPEVAVLGAHHRKEGLFKAWKIDRALTMPSARFFIERKTKLRCVLRLCVSVQHTLTPICHRLLYGHSPLTSIIDVEGTPSSLSLDNVWSLTEGG